MYERQASWQCRLLGSLALPYRLALPNCLGENNANPTTCRSESRTSTLHNHCYSFREVRGICSAALKGYQTGRTHTCRVETNRVNLKAPRRSSGVVQNPIKQRSRSLTASAYQGSPAGFGIAYRGGWRFGSGQRDERDKARSEKPALYPADKLPRPNHHAYPTTCCSECRTSTQHNHRYSFREARGIGSAALKGYQSRRTRTCRVETNRHLF
jgi:hypothetical protein